MCYVSAEALFLRLQRFEPFMSLLLPLCIPVVQIPEGHISMLLNNA